MVRQMKEDINIEDLEAFHTDKKPVDRILKTVGYWLSIATTLTNCVDFKCKGNARMARRRETIE